MKQQGGGSLRTTLWVLILIIVICGVFIGISQPGSNIVLLIPVWISELVGALLSALQISPDLLDPIRNINVFRWISYFLKRKRLPFIGLIILLLSISLNIKLYFDAKPTDIPATRTPVSGNPSTPSSQGVLSSPSQQAHTTPATKPSSSQTFNENKFINCTINCNGDIIFSVNYIATDAQSIYNQTWDLTITNGNLKPCSLEITRLTLQDVNRNDYFDGRSPATNSGTPWNLGAIYAHGAINEDPYFSNVQPTGTFILYATISISCQDGVSFLSEQYQSDKFII